MDKSAVYQRGYALVVPWRWLFVGGWLVVNLALLAHPGVRYLMVLPHDWEAWPNLLSRLGTPDLYWTAQGPTWWVWNPIAAYLLAALIPLGYSFWLGLHLASLVTIRNVTALLALVSVPFWVDTIGGNTFVFVFVSGAVALTGSRWGGLIYLALCILMPRPVQAPLAVWLLWKQPGLRWPFVGMILVTLGVSLWSGYLDDWLRVMLTLGGANNEHFANLSPTKILGSAWLIVGIPLAAWLTWKGRVGLAGMAMTPYALPGYLLVLLWEWPRTPRP